VLAIVRAVFAYTVVQAHVHLIHHVSTLATVLDGNDPVKGVKVRVDTLDPAALVANYVLVLKFADRFDLFHRCMCQNSLVPLL